MRSGLLAVLFEPSARVTTTGQCASRSTRLLVDPSSRPVNPPRPRDPTTTRPASIDASINACDALESTILSSTCTSGYWALISAKTPSSIFVSVSRISDIDSSQMSYCHGVPSMA